VDDGWRAHRPPVKGPGRFPVGPLPPESESDHGLYLIRVDLRLAWTFREGACPVGLIHLNTKSARCKSTGRPPTALTPSSLPGHSSGVGGDRKHKRQAQAPLSTFNYLPSIPILSLFPFLFLFPLFSRPRPLSSRPHWWLWTSEALSATIVSEMRVSVGFFWGIFPLLGVAR